MEGGQYNWLKSQSEVLKKNTYCIICDYLKFSGGSWKGSALVPIRDFIKMTLVSLPPNLSRSKMNNMFRYSFVN